MADPAPSQASSVNPGETGEDPILASLVDMAGKIHTFRCEADIDGECYETPWGVWMEIGGG